LPAGPSDPEEFKKVNAIESNSGCGLATPPVPGSDCSRIALSVAEISFGVSAPGDLRMALEPGLLEFASDSGACDVEIETAWTEHLQLPAGTPAFQSGGLWSAYLEGDGLAFYFQTAYLGSAPYKKAYFDREFTRGRVLLLKRYFDAELPVYPLEYPLDELLMIHRLATGAGVEVHGCGVLNADGVGRLFVGHSGAGKSTTSRLWMKQPGSLVLSDDRIILRESSSAVDGAHIRMHGTPWHGDAGLAAQASGRLDRIYLIAHGSANQIIPLEPSRAVAELFARTFVPFHSPAGLANTLRFIEEVARRVPVSLFRFVPDNNAVEAILHAA
jgi:hypothetical protein